MTYLEKLDEELARRNVSSSRRDEILADIRALIADGVSETELGEPSELAEALADLQDPEPSRSGRVFDLENQHVLTKKVVGWGWDLNMGAVAVKLGLLRPDDLDDDVLAAIPSRTRDLTSSLPLALSAAATIAGIVTLSRGQGLVSNISKGRASRSYVTGSIMTAVGTGVAIWASQAASPREQLYRTSLASGLAAIVASVNLIGLRTSDRVPLALNLAPALAGLATQAATFIGPVRAGRSRVAS